MNSEVSSSEQAPLGWERVADAYASRVWAAIAAARLPDYKALEVNRLTWMRLADRFGILSADRIERWLRDTARREAERSARLIASTDDMGTA